MTRLAVLRDGLDLPYVEQGDADGVPVVLLHAWVDSRRVFDRVLAGLPERVHAFAFDQRGHGDAPEPSDGYALRDFADDVGAFMDAVGLDAAVLAGASSGGYVAQRFAVVNPRRMAADPPLDTGRISAPTLIIWGGRDRLLPRGDQEAMATEIPGARLVVYPDVGHLPVVEAPERVADDIAALCEVVAAR